jgi:hypothetical protein
MSFLGDLIPIEIVESLLLKKFNGFFSHEILSMPFTSLNLNIGFNGIGIDECSQNMLLI